MPPALHLTKYESDMIVKIMLSNKQKFVKVNSIYILPEVLGILKTTRNLTEAREETLFSHLCFLSSTAHMASSLSLLRKQDGVLSLPIKVTAGPLILFPPVAPRPSPQDLRASLSEAKKACNPHRMS